jgi:hypothetical protein
MDIVLYLQARTPALAVKNQGKKMLFGQNFGTYFTLK